MSCNLNIGDKVGDITGMFKFKNYKVGAVVGVGGHGIVHQITLNGKAQDNNTMYALKVISFDDNKQREDFVREKALFKLLARNGNGSEIRCVHRGINCYLKLSEKQNCGYIITELYDTDLCQELSNKGSLFSRFYQDKSKINQGLDSISFKAKDLILDIEKVQNYIKNKKMPHTDKLVDFVSAKASDLKNEIGQLKNNMDVLVSSTEQKVMKTYRENIIQIYCLWISQLASAIDYMHNNNLAHGDIKPSNILIRHSDNRLVITDFDTLYYDDKKQPTEKRFEPHEITAYFASPELDKSHAQQSKVSLQDIQTSDIWALALTVLITWFGEEKVLGYFYSSTGSPRQFTSAFYRALSDANLATKIFNDLDNKINKIIITYPEYRDIFDKTIVKSKQILDQINKKTYRLEDLKKYINDLTSLKV